MASTAIRCAFKWFGSRPLPSKSVAAGALILLSLGYYIIMRQYKEDDILGLYEDDEEGIVELLKEARQEDYVSEENTQDSRIIDNVTHFLERLHKDELEEYTIAKDILRLKKGRSVGLHTNNVSTNFTTVLTINAKQDPVLDIVWTLEQIGIGVIVLELKDMLTKNQFGFDFPRRIMSLQTDDVEWFYKQNKDNAMLKSIDIFLCVYPVSLCKVFIPFHKPVLLFIEDRYEAGAHRFSDWSELNDVIAALSTDPRSAVLASNTYDVEYVRYFTASVPLLVPFTCAYLDARIYYQHNQARERRYLVWSTRNNILLSWFIENLNSGLKSETSDISFNVSTQLKAPYRSSLSQFSGVIVLPHQVSFLAFTELYRLNIPLFVPSLDLLTKWHYRNKILHLKGCRLCALQSPQLYASSYKSLLKAKGRSSDPNNDATTSDIGYWLMFADFYQLQHVTNFNSIPNLVQTIVNMDADTLVDLSERMKQENVRTQKETYEQWREVFNRTETYKYYHFY